MAFRYVYVCSPGLLADGLFIDCLTSSEQLMALQRALLGLGSVPTLGPGVGLASSRSTPFTASVAFPLLHRRLERRGR
jgi:hypothetical protein